MSRTAAEVLSFITPLIEARQLELVDVECKGPSKRPFVRVLLHKPGGVTAEDCQGVAKALQQAFEDEDYFFPGTHRLEVASPGLDRPLTSARDFARNLGRKVRLFLSQPYEGQKELVARIEAVEEDQLMLIPEKGEQSGLRLPLQQIDRGKLVIEF